MSGGWVVGVDVDGAGLAELAIAPGCLLVGSAEDCDVRVTGAGLRAYEALYVLSEQRVDLLSLPAGGGPTAMRPLTEPIGETGRVVLRFREAPPHRERKSAEAIAPRWHHVAGPIRRFDPSFRSLFPERSAKPLIPTDRSEVALTTHRLPDGHVLVRQGASVGLVRRTALADSERIHVVVGGVAIDDPGRSRTPPTTIAATLARPMDARQRVGTAWRLAHDASAHVAEVAAGGGGRLVFRDLSPSLDWDLLAGHPYRERLVTRANLLAPAEAGLHVEGYAPLDQRLPVGPVDPSWDVYAIGVITYELLVGRRPEGTAQPDRYLTEHGRRLVGLSRGSMGDAEELGRLRRRPLGELVDLEALGLVHARDVRALDAALASLLRAADPAVVRTLRTIVASAIHPRPTWRPRLDDLASGLGAAFAGLSQQPKTEPARALRPILRDLAYGREDRPRSRLDVIAWSVVGAVGAGALAVAVPGVRSLPGGVLAMGVSACWCVAAAGIIGVRWPTLGLGLAAGALALLGSQTLGWLVRDGALPATGAFQELNLRLVSVWLVPCWLFAVAQRRGERVSLSVLPCIAAGLLVTTLAFELTGVVETPTANLLHGVVIGNVSPEFEAFAKVWYSMAGALSAGSGIGIGFLAATFAGLGTFVTSTLAARADRAILHPLPPEPVSSRFRLRDGQVGLGIAVAVAGAAWEACAFFGRMVVIEWAYSFTELDYVPIILAFGLGCAFAAAAFVRWGATAAAEAASLVVLGAWFAVADPRPDGSAYFMGFAAPYLWHLPRWYPRIPRWSGAVATLVAALACIGATILASGSGSDLAHWKWSEGAIVIGYVCLLVSPLAVTLPEAWSVVNRRRLDGAVLRRLAPPGQARRLAEAVRVRARRAWRTVRRRFLDLRLDRPWLLALSVIATIASVAIVSRSVLRHAVTPDDVPPPVAVVTSEPLDSGAVLIRLPPGWGRGPAILYGTCIDEPPSDLFVSLPAEITRIGPRLARIRGGTAWTENGTLARRTCGERPSSWANSEVARLLLTLGYEKETSTPVASQNEGATAEISWYPDRPFRYVNDDDLRVWGISAASLHPTDAELRDRLHLDPQAPPTAP